MRTLQETKKDKIIIKGFFSNNFLGAYTLCQNYKDKTFCMLKKKTKNILNSYFLLLCANNRTKLAFLTLVDLLLLSYSA